MSMNLKLVGNSAGVKLTSVPSRHIAHRKMVVYLRYLEPNAWAGACFCLTTVWFSVGTQCSARGYMHRQALQLPAKRFAQDNPLLIFRLHGRASPLLLSLVCL